MVCLILIKSATTENDFLPERRLNGEESNDHLEGVTFRVFSFRVKVDLTRLNGSLS